MSVNRRPALVDVSVAHNLTAAVLLVAGTALVCLAIALLETLLPLLAKGFPGRIPWLWGLGSTAGALVTPAAFRAGAGIRVPAGRSCVLACGWLHWQTGTWCAPL